MFDYLSSFPSIHNKNYEKAKFKLGDFVNVTKKGFQVSRGEVTGVNYIENDSEGNPVFEYSVSSFPYLLWEFELDKVNK